MKGKVFYITLTALLALLLSVGVATGQEPEEVTIAAEVNSRIGYQGVLTEGGNPVTGSRDMTFRLYSDDTCTTQVGSDINKPDVPVTDGLFSVELDVGHSYFNGQGLWLEVEVGGTAIGCQEILPVPYALSLRPGASVIGNTSWVINVRNTATTGWRFGVTARTASTSGKAVLGHASADSGETYGVEGWSESTSGRGVLGHASATSGTTWGVFGQSDSASGAGVLGRAPVYGVEGTATATSGTTYGVEGWSVSTNGRGVAGRAIAPSGTTFGVYGVSHSASGYGGYFIGKGYFSGYLSKAGGGFKIDHPLDAENKYLNHSFVESPDMMNVYNGNVVLDGNGEAWVELPDYFEALNRDFRYQLTPIGAPAPNLYITEEISGNRFKISGGPPGITVSWQVTGIRQDPWANTNRVAVEEEKASVERGYYMHPELYGQPESMSIEWARDPEGMKRLMERAK